MSDPIGQARNASPAEGINSAETTQSTLPTVPASVFTSLQADWRPSAHRDQEMVSTRASSVGVSLPPDDTKLSTRSSPRKQGKTLVPVVPAVRTAGGGDDDDSSDNDHAPAKASRAVAARTPSRATTTRWSHTPTHLTLIWLAVSLPLVIWDTLYILNRPHTMPGGKWHSPIWVPYGIYVNVDGVYGWQALEQNDGWPGAQGFANALETAAYLVYLYWAWRFGEDEGTKGKGTSKGPAAGVSRYLFEPRRVEGVKGAQMVLLLFATSVMTVGKTLLYWLIEWFNGFSHIGHNAAWDLFWLWIVPNGLWLVFPSVIVYSTASDIVRGLSIAAGVTNRKPQGKLM